MDPSSSTLPGSQVASGESEPEIAVIVASPRWRAAVPRAERLAEAAASAALAEAGVSGAVTVLLADDRAIKRLNGTHRNKNKPTNVLSFPAGVPGLLGDVALALGTVEREARAARRSVRAHLAHLVAHGALHLAGHDHLRAGEARRMERAEARVMRRLALPNPWKGVQ
ncbi:rRNA maturation RNase YbeY [Roseomonas sp. BN140053]|uniref:rRNA maturation RNase YbeY n=1 Tax=Roseomonas sp. BN140053 TaxID=3391898 RepID=UPI0039E8F8A2